MIFLQNRFTFDLQNLNNELQKTVYLLLLTLYTPKEYIPFNPEIGSSIYSELQQFDITDNVLSDMQKVAYFLGIEDYYSAAVANIISIRKENIFKYKINDQFILLNEEDIEKLGITYGYIPGVKFEILLTGNNTLSFII